jgi:hypothetical protein
MMLFRIQILFFGPFLFFIKAGFDLFYKYTGINQCFVIGYGLAPLWIQIRMGTPDPDLGRSKCPQNRKKWGILWSLSVLNRE